jgi:hypothetical protein
LSGTASQSRVPVTNRKRQPGEFGYATVAEGKKAPQTHHHSDQGANPVAPLLAVLLLILILGILGFAVVKVLLWIAVILLIVWLVGFFMRGAGGARWYRW